MNVWFKWGRNSNAAIVSVFLILLVNGMVAYFAQVPAGGQDSWNHYLYARWAPFHPNLLLDQWGKPFFTLMALPFARFGINGVLLMNHLCIVGTAWITYLSARRMGFKNPWMVIFLFAWQPIVLANVHSALTEPSNAFILIIICYLFASVRWVSATIVASFLPLVRSEGFVLLAAVLLMLALRNRWKIMPFAFIGSLLYAIVGALIDGHWNWIVTKNPYIQQEIGVGFDAGHGNFWYYALNQKHIAGMIVGMMVLLSMILLGIYVFKRIQKKTPSNANQMALWLWWPLFSFFFLAHSILWWKGAMGSHGLLRVFVVVSPIMALLAHQVLDTLMRLEIRWLNRLVKYFVVLGMFFLAFPGAGMPYPWNMNHHDKTPISGSLFNPKENKLLQNPIEQALNFIAQSPYKDNLLSHQLPMVNVFCNFDPWAADGQLHPIDKFGNWGNPLPVSQWPAESRALYLWSLDSKEGGKNDWFPEGTIVLWDNFHARRDGNKSLETMRSLTLYKELAFFKGNTLDSLDDVRVFIKTTHSD